MGVGGPNPWSMCCHLKLPVTFYSSSLRFCRQMVPVPLHGDPESKRCSKRIFSLHFQLWCLLLLQKVVGLFHCKAGHCRSKVCPLDSKIATATWGEVLSWIYLDVKYPVPHFSLISQPVSSLDYCCIQPLTARFTLLLYSVQSLFRCVKVKL